MVWFNFTNISTYPYQTTENITTVYVYGSDLAIIFLFIIAFGISFITVFIIYKEIIRLYGVNK